MLDTRLTRTFCRRSNRRMSSVSFRGRIGVLGAGALGAFYGARLARAGNDVHFLMRSDFDHVQAHGLRVKSFEGDFHINPPVYQAPEELGRCDLLLIGLKSTDNHALPELLRSTAGPETLVLTLQNGLGNEDAIAAALGGGQQARERILGGIAFLCSNRVGPGVIHHLDHGWIRLAEFAGPAQERTHQVGAMFNEAGIRCVVYDSLLQARWEKLVWNIPFNGLGVAARANVEQVLADKRLRRLAERLMQEVVQAARTDGVALDEALPEKMLKNSESMGPYRTSMQLDHEAGRPLEVESILAEPLRRGQATGADLPALEMLVALVAREAK